MMSGKKRNIPSRQNHGKIPCHLRENRNTLAKARFTVKSALSCPPSKIELSGMMAHEFPFDSSEIPAGSFPSKEDSLIRGRRFLKIRGVDRS